MSKKLVAPDSGDILWIDFGSPVGHEQGGRRPAVVLTPRKYNTGSSVFLVCPITRKRRNWPFEVILLPVGRLSGVVLVDQIRVVDSAVRPFGYAGRVPDDVLVQVKATLTALLELDASYSLFL